MCCVQVWLQEFAWTEAELQPKLAERLSQAQGPMETKRLEAEPMFCLETALKLHRCLPPDFNKD